MKIVKELGRGYFSRVYLGERDGVLFAVKVFENDRASRSFARKEIRALEELKNSKFCIKMYGYLMTSQISELYMEFIGQPLQTIIDHYESADLPIPVPFLRKVVVQMISGLAELEEKGIIHNDLKPENILLTKQIDFFKDHYQIWEEKMLKIFPNFEEDDLKQRWALLAELSLHDVSIKIADFGNVVTEQTRKDFPCWKSYSRATRHYLSPECILKHDYDYKSDVWSLGCVIAELFTKSPLFHPYRDNNMSINSRHLLDIIRFCKMSNYDILSAWASIDKKNNKLFNKYFVNGVHKFDYLKYPPINLYSLIRQNGYSKKDAREMSNLVRNILKPCPIERLSASELLKKTL